MEINRANICFFLKISYYEADIHGKPLLKIWGLVVNYYRTRRLLANMTSLWSLASQWSAGRCLSIWKSLSLEVENRWLWLKPYLRSHTKVDLEVWEITSIKRCLEKFWAQLNSFPIKDHPIECLQHSEYIFKKRLHRNIRRWVMPNKYPKQNHMRLGETMGHISQISCCRNLIREKLAEWDFWKKYIPHCFA